MEAILSAAISFWGVAGLWPDSCPPRWRNRHHSELLCWCCLQWRQAGRAARVQRAELTWLVYPLLALCGFKLIAEELRHARSITLFVSLIIFGGALVLLPRWLRQPEAEVEAAPETKSSRHRGAAAC